jgi:hypothetical protein
LRACSFVTALNEAPSRNFASGGLAVKERTTQVLLASIALLLAIHLLRGLPPTPAVEASESEEATVPAVLRAQAIELTNKDGKVVVQLFTGEDGGGNLRMRSGKGVVRVKLGATDDGSGLVLMDKDVEPAIRLATDAAGASLTLTEKGKEKRIVEP